MRILAIVSGEYGARHVANLRATAPAGWQVQTWQAPAILPQIIDYPEDYIPASLPDADLLVSFAENKGVAELLPDLCKLVSAKAVLAPVDNETWLPRGLARQLRGWLERMGVPCATPKPLCSLTENDYLITRRERMTYESALISEFARNWGQPRFSIQVDPQSKTIQTCHVERDAVCGCARYVAERLAGEHINEAPEKAGLLHHHFPCLASMGIDPDFGDTLMHVSGNLLKDEIAIQVRPHQDIRYIAPGKLSE